MSRDASVTLEFGDGEHLFRLRIREIIDLLDRINRPRLALAAAANVPNPQQIGLHTIITLCGEGNLRPEELQEIFRLGLLGGGMKPAAAAFLMARHFPTLSLIEASLMAYRMLEAGIMGEELAPVGKAEAAAPPAAENKTAATDGSTGAKSTGPASPWVSGLGPSTSSPLPNSPA